MANLYVTEYSKLGYAAGQATIALEPAVAEQVVSFTSTTQSSAFQKETTFVRLQADADCFVKFGASPTATTSNQPLNADTEYWRAVHGGQKVAAVTAS